MGCSLTLPGVPAKAYFKTRHLSFRCFSKKPGVSYEFDGNEAVPVHVDEDVEAFRNDDNFIECDENGEPLAQVSGSGADPRSYARYDPNPVTLPVTSGNPGSQVKAPTPPKAAQSFENDADVAAFEARRVERLKTVEG